MSRDRLAMVVTALAIGALVASVLGGSVAELVFGMLTTAIAPVLMLLGARRRGSFGAALWSIGLLLVVLEGALAGIWLLRPERAGGDWWLGLPPATAILVYGLLVVPLIVVTLGFAWAFRDFDVSADDLDALRRLGSGD